MTTNSYDNRRSLGAFRETIVAELTPAIQLKFPYNIPSRTTNTTLVNLGTVTQENSMAKVSTGADTTSSAILESTDTLVYQPGQGALVRFTAIFSTGVAGSTQEIGIGDATDGYFIGMNGTEFSINRRQNGTDNWLAIPNIADGSPDFLGSIDPTKGNVYQIEYQWLGFGAITWKVYNSQTESFTILHRENYVNANTVPSTFNPSFPVRVKVANTTNNTDIVLRTGSMGAFVEGKATGLTNLFSATNEKTITTEVSILDIRVRSTFASKATRAILFPRVLSIAADGTKNVIIRVYENTTLGGTPSYANIDTNNSIAESDTAGTTATNGTKLLTFSVAKTDSLLINLDKLIRLHNLDHLTITAESANSSIVGASLTWEELI